MEVGAFEEEFAQGDRGVVGIGEKGILDDDTGAAAGAEDLEEVLQEEEGGFAGFDGEILLDFGADFAAEGRIGKDDVFAFTFFDVGDVF